MPRASSDGEARTFGDWREFRAKLVSQAEPESAWTARLVTDNLRAMQITNPNLASEELWAHPIGTPETGGLIVATNSVSGLVSDRYWQLVIFLVEHSPGRSVGLILNRPSALILGRKPGGLHLNIDGAPSAMQQVFCENRVYMGGFVAQQVFHMMHGHRLAGAREVVPGVYLGGEEAAVSGVLLGSFPPQDFKFFSGAMVWGPGQLEQQILQGAWVSAACSRAMVLKACLQLPVPLWREVMTLMGGEWHSAARAAYEGDE